MGGGSLACDLEVGPLTACCPLPIPRPVDCIGVCEPCTFSLGGGEFTLGVLMPTKRLSLSSDRTKDRAERAGLVNKGGKLFC